MGASLSFFVTSASSLFISSEIFKKEFIPLSFIASGVFVWAVGLLFTFLQKKYPFKKTLPIGLVFILSSIVVILAVYFITKSFIVLFILYAWIRVFAYMHGMSFWSMAGRLFSLQQGKRIFGLITGGEVFASILAFFSIPFLLEIIDTLTLLYIAVIFLFFAFFVLLFIVKKFGVKLSQTKKSKIKKEHKKIKRKGSIFLQNKYYKLFFLIAFLPIVAQFFVQFIFQSQVKIEFPAEKALTGFIAIIFGVSAIIEFILKTFVAGRLLNKYGVKLGLIAFPIVLVLSFTLASVAGAFYGATGLFFSFVTLGRLFTRAVRTSFNDPATQILYQPLPSEERLVFQNKIESGPKAYASIVAGILIFAFAQLSWVTLVFFSFFLLVILIFWTKIALDTFKEYKVMIQKALTQGETQKSSKSAFIFELLKAQIYSTNRDIQKALLKIYSNVFAFKADEKLIKDFNLNASVPEKLSLQKLVDYTYSSDVSERKLSAELLPNYPIFRIKKSMIRLLKDADFDVRKLAIISSGKMKESELYPSLFENLKLFRYREITSRAIYMCGKSVIPELSKFFTMSEYNPKLQLTMIEIFEKIGDAKTTTFLRKHINFPNKSIRDRIIKALGRVDYVASKMETPLFTQRLEDEIKNYIYIIASILDLEELGADEDIMKILENEKRDKIKAIFIVLSVIYDSTAIQLIFENFQKDSPDAQGYAIEIADTVISDLHKEMLLPILNNELDVELLKKYKYTLPQENLPVKARLIDIINSDLNTCSKFTKAYAIKILAQYDTEDVITTLRTNVLHPSQIIQEIASFTLYNKNKELFNKIIISYSIKNKALKHTKEKLLKLKQKNNLLIIEKITLLKSLPIFKDIKEKKIYELALNSEETVLQAGEQIKITNTNRTQIFITISGLLINNNSKKIIESGEFISIYNPNIQNEELVCTAEEISFLLSVEIYLLNDLLLNNVNFAKNYIQDIAQGK